MVEHYHFMSGWVDCGGEDIENMNWNLLNH